jgi:serine/threonine-protein kinase
LNLLSKCERFIKLERKLPAILNGKEQLANNERLECAQMCLLKKWYTAAARLYQNTFSLVPESAIRVPSGVRFEAACAAALAGCGQDSAHAPGLKKVERTGWRKQALEWLRADLAYWTTTLEAGKPQLRVLVQKTMQNWQSAARLACVRDAEALARLPETERDAWRQLWADVTALHQRAAQEK